MTRVDSQSLALVSRVLGISRQGQETDLLDSQVVQTLDVSPASRRALDPSTKAGLFTARVEHIHAAAGDLAVAPQARAPGSFRDPPMPATLPTAFDLWLLSITLLRTSGAGTLTQATVELNLPASMQGWGLTSAAAKVAQTAAVIPIAHWDTLIVQSGGAAFGQTTDGRIFVRPHLRIPDSGSGATNATLGTHSTVAGAAATLAFIFTLQVVPVTTGQDFLG